MIIWSGWGILVPVIVFLTSLAMEMLAESIWRDDTAYQNQAAPFALSLLISAVIVWFVGRYLNNRPGRVLFDKETGEEVTLRSRAAFFFIPMQYWAPILFSFAVVSFLMRSFG
ncbi:MAG: hypothetical protein WKF84_27295 [Pyrinomonadaceae bacterium]